MIIAILTAQNILAEMLLTGREAGWLILKSADKESGQSGGISVTDGSETFQ